MYTTFIMPAIGFIIEQSILGLWSAILFAIYAKQLKQDIFIEKISNIQNTSTSSIVFKKVKSLGYTAYVFHLGGTIGCLVLTIRSVDPFPVLGIYPFVATDLLSHVGIAILLNTLFEGIGSLASKVYYKLNLPADENFFQRWVRRISYMTAIVSIITWIVENFVSDILYYSAGAYFLYGTIIQWIILILFHMMILVFQRQIGPNSPLIKDSSIRESIKKLQWIRFLFLLINVVLTIYQIIIFANQVQKMSRRDSLELDPTEYKPISAPLYLTQVVAYSVLLWFCYVPVRKAGEQNGLSEVSEATRTHVQLNALPVQNSPNHQHREVHEVVVKFKEHEFDDKIKVLDTEELKRTTINRQISVSSNTTDPVADNEGISQHLQNIYDNYQRLPNQSGYQSYANDSLRSNDSSDQAGPINPIEMSRLMRLIELQNQAEREGRLEEFLKEQEQLDRQVPSFVPQNTTDTPYDDNSYMYAQIRAYKENERYEQIRKYGSVQSRNSQNYRQDNVTDSDITSVPPSPPPFHAEDYEPVRDRSTRVLFVIPDELGQTSSSSDLQKPTSKIPVLKKNSS